MYLHLSDHKHISLLVGLGCIQLSEQVLISGSDGMGDRKLTTTEPGKTRLFTANGLDQ
jgi:hypothetical protein